MTMDNDWTPRRQNQNFRFNFKMFSIVPIIIILLVIIAIALLSSVVYIGGNEVGIVEKKFGGSKLPPGRILAVDGENGIQAPVLTPGWHLFYWKWQYNINKVPLTEIKPSSVGIINTTDGRPLPSNTVFAPEWEDTEKMLDAKHFLSEGNGYKGPQLTVLQPGKYRLNTELYKIKEVPVTNVKIGTVAVIKSNVGEVPDTNERLVEVGQRGIWNKPKTEGKYFLNTEAFEVTPISIRQTKVSYTAQSERGEGVTQPLRPITVRSSDGYTFPVDVRITYQVKPENAPSVVATIGGDDLVLSKLVTPRVRSIFRNNAEKVQTLDYVQNRSVQSRQGRDMLKKDLEKYGITILELSIGDIGDEKSLGSLLKTQTDREIARQQQKTFEEQQRAAEKEKDLKKTIQEAEEERRLATAVYDVKVAEEQKKEEIIAAEAKAEQINIVAEAKAQAYKKVSSVIGPENAALLEIMKLIADEDIDITPDVMVSGSETNQIPHALMGTVLKNLVKEKNNANSQ